MPNPNFFSNQTIEQTMPALTAGDFTLAIQAVSFLIFLIFFILWNKKEIKTRQWHAVKIGEPCFTLMIIVLASFFIRGTMPSIISTLSILLGSAGLAWVAQQLWSEHFKLIQLGSDSEPQNPESL